MRQSIARHAIRNARAALADAIAAEPIAHETGNQFDVKRHLEEAVQCVTNARDHLKNELKPLPGGREWYNKKHKDWTADKDSITKYLFDHRVGIVHFGPGAAGVLHRLNPQCQSHHHVSMELTFIPETPVERPKSRHWYEGWRQRIVGPLKATGERVASLVRRNESIRVQGEMNQQIEPSIFYFNKSPFPERNAFDVVAEFIDEIERAITEAERQ